METLRQLGGSLLLALFSAALVIGGISLALAESYVPVLPTPTETQALIPFIASPTSAPVQATPKAATLPPTSTETIPPPTSSSCLPPVGWIPISVGPGDDLITLSYRHQSTPEDLLLANCLFSTDLPTGSTIYVPSIPTKTAVPCGPPAGWIRYTVQAGNTMYSLSQAYGVTISQLQFANCMPAGQYGLSTGQSIWVPNVVTRTPRATATATLTPVSIVFPTLTRTSTATQTATQIPTSTTASTGTATGTSTSTSPPPPTGTPTATVTVTAFPSQTSNP